jgi:hypothetical protein
MFSASVDVAPVMEVMRAPLTGEHARNKDVIAVFGGINSKYDP